MHFSLSKIDFTILGKNIMFCGSMQSQLQKSLSNYDVMLIRCIFKLYRIIGTQNTKTRHIFVQLHCEMRRNPVLNQILPIRLHFAKNTHRELKYVQICLV